MNREPFDDRNRRIPGSQPVIPLLPEGQGRGEGERVPAKPDQRPGAPQTARTIPECARPGRSKVRPACHGWQVTWTGRWHTFLPDGWNNRYRPLRGPCWFVTHHSSPFFASTFPKATGLSDGRINLYSPPMARLSRHSHRLPSAASDTTPSRVCAKATQS